MIIELVTLASIAVPCPNGTAAIWTGNIGDEPAMCRVCTSTVDEPAPYVYTRFTGRCRIAHFRRRRRLSAAVTPVGASGSLCRKLGRNILVPPCGTSPCRLPVLRGCCNLEFDPPHPFEPANPPDRLAGTFRCIEGEGAFQLERSGLRDQTAPGADVERR